jgi:hypothetical protein
VRSDVPAILGPTPRTCGFPFRIGTHRLDSLPWPSPLCGSPQKAEIPNIPKNRVKGFRTRARACGKIRFFDHPYNLRMRTQHCASGSKNMKLGAANMLQVGFALLSAPLRVQGQWADAGRSAHSLSVDWQAWGTRAGSAGEQPATAYGTCLPVLQNCALGKIPQNPLPEMPANRGSPRVQPRSPPSTCLTASGRKQRGKPHFQIEINFCGVPHLPGPEKTRSSPRAEFSREGFLGWPLGLVFAQLIPTH